MRMRICVLEDNNDIREIVEFLLESEQYEVFSYANVCDFMNGALTRQANAFVLDVMLPDGNGIEVCKVLKSLPETMHIPVLMMSANYSTTDANYNCSAEDFIKKPFDIVDFVNRVDLQTGKIR
ncbi:response regulator transcription factor [Pedobacter sp. CCM 8938]|uniref:Response regulator transcription factor n=1 Tax=Pedobacter fastidiosus TaxID=2765361 RepID=A0ABR7KT55_9SPHI|nr:response regulator transcription factor [Pedobacter fastidiosus]